MIDSKCQMNLEKGPTLPKFYWEETSQHGIAIEGSIVPMLGKVADFPIMVEGQKSTTSFGRIDFIKEDCILGSKFLTKVSLVCIDTSKMIFSCIVNGKRVSCPLSYESQSKCKIPEKKPVPKFVSTTYLSKLERCVAYADMHRDKALAEISAKLEKDYTSESPNALWNREKYFVSLVNIMVAAGGIYLYM
jgi:hypothetical protein